MDRREKQINDRTTQVHIVSAPPYEIPIEVSENDPRVTG